MFKKSIKLAVIVFVVATGSLGAQQPSAPPAKPAPPATATTAAPADNGARSTALVTVQAVSETPPVPGTGDAADDVAIWVHPTDASKSVVAWSDGEQWVRLPSVAAAVLAAIAAYRLGRRLAGRHAGAAASIVLVAAVKLFAIIEKTSVSPLAVSM